jgi:hypothetical protein
MFKPTTASPSSAGSLAARPGAPRAKKWNPDGYRQPIDLGQQYI